MYSSFIKLYVSLALATSFAYSDVVGRMEKKPLNLASGLVSQIESSLPLSLATSDSLSIPLTGSSSVSSFVIPGSSSVSSSSIIPATTSSSIPASSTSTPTTSSSSSQISSTSTPSITSVPQTTVVVVVTTDGSIYTSASTSFSTSVLPSQSGSVSPDQSGSGSTSGPNKGTIIGATVGIGGAIILAGLGFVAWRLWGKNKHPSDEDEILMNGSSAHGEKLTTTSSNPFKSTLDQYHAHSGTNF